MGFFDLAMEFDAAIEWALDDPLLADHEPSTLAVHGWPTSTDELYPVALGGVRSCATAAARDAEEPALGSTPMSSTG